MTGLLLHVRGVVQGVGFRPFVHRLGLRHALAGWVRNNASAVEIAVQGDAGEVARFVDALRLEAPPLACIEAIEHFPLTDSNPGPFRIEPSAVIPGGAQSVPPDVALCPACEAELADPTDRRYRYAFATCTDCGPRDTVIDRLPYDRERTSMRVFPQCPECEREYRTPGHRRHHAESNSCSVCGPRLWFEGSESQPVQDAEASLRSAVALLHRGEILAVRGMGGFHLACDATNTAAVAELRRRKGREAKPFAVLVADVAAARALATVTAAEAAQLQSRERPIVLLEQRIETPICAAVAPGLGLLGVMLPATPLHQLLAGDAGRPLVMTSGNRTDEPIAIANAEARRRLAGIADGFLLHDREILARSDDSVLRMSAGGAVFLRRARGYAPLPIRLPVAAPVPILAVGPHLKNTFTLAAGDQAWVSPHIGDLDSRESLEHFRGTVARYQHLLQIAPAFVAHDQHPGYLSTRLAHESGLPRLGVQHHHAHIAAVLGEHRESGPVIGVVYDGTGYGDDGHIWGAEILVADCSGYRRLAHLRYVPLPGGEQAIRQPWRVALGYGLLEPGAQPAFGLALRGVPAGEQALAARQVGRQLNAPLASSMGRLFDAAAAILGLRQVCHYEGQAAMELEGLAGRHAGREIPLDLVPDGAGGWLIDPVPLLASLGHQALAGSDRGELAAAFHSSIAGMTETVVRRVSEATGLTTVVLAGGVFQNVRLLDEVERRLGARQLRVLFPRRLSPNDGAVSYGQAVVAAAHLAAIRQSGDLPMTSPGWRGVTVLSQEGTGIP